MLPNESHSGAFLMCNIDPLKPNESKSALDASEVLGEQIAELASHLHAATYRLLCLIREFDEREAWAGGFRRL